MPMPDLCRRCRADPKVTDRRARRHPQASAASLFALALIAGAYALPASAQPQPKPGDVTGDASLTGLALLNTDIDNGGSFRWDGFTAAGSIDWQLTKALSVGLTARYSYEHWRFSPPTAFGRGPICRCRRWASTSTCT